MPKTLRAPEADSSYAGRRGRYVVTARDRDNTLVHVEVLAHKGANAKATGADYLRNRYGELAQVTCYVKA